MNTEPDAGRQASSHPHPRVQDGPGDGAGVRSHPEAEDEDLATEAGFAAVDTHCHLFLIEEETAAVLSRARRAGVARLVCVGIDPESSRRSLDLADSFQGVFATAGMHPHTAASLDRQGGSEIEALLADPRVVGVGETGLDYYRRLSPVEDQLRVFRTHIAMARECGKPLVVHVREAWEDALRVLDQAGAEHVVLHCFSGDEAVAAEAAARGYHLSFAGNVTYPGAGDLRRAAAAVPVQQILVETDSPFLPPQHRRGRPNEPAEVLTVAGAVAEVRSLKLEEMLRRTAAAAARVFAFLP